MTNPLDDLAAGIDPAQMGKAKIVIDAFIAAYNPGEAELIDIRVAGSADCFLAQERNGLDLRPHGPAARDQGRAAGIQANQHMSQRVSVGGNSGAVVGSG